MSLPYECFFALRYAFVRRQKFISFISFVSIAGMALGVAALIVVLSVMNGFQRELRTKMLGVVSHVQLTGFDNTTREWESLRDRVTKTPTGAHVVGAAPYILAQGMVANGDLVQGAYVRGVLPGEERKVAAFDDYMVMGKLDGLEAGKFHIILGVGLAQALGLRLGDPVVVIAPQGTVTPAGIVPRVKQFTLSGVFRANMYEYDSGLALIHMTDAQKLYRMGDRVNGLRLKLDDLMRAPLVGGQLAEQLKGFYYISDWTKVNENFFRAVQIEKNVMFVILTLIVAVAAFNIVSTLVMTVTDKRSDIAILQTLGASSSSIRRIFMLLGTITGVIGIIIGVAAGIVIAINIDVIVPAIESLFHVEFLDRKVYSIGELPSELRSADVVLVTAVAFGLSVLSTILPSWQASRTRPAEALRYE